MVIQWELSKILLRSCLLFSSCPWCLQGPGPQNPPRLCRTAIMIGKTRLLWPAFSVSSGRPSARRSPIQGSLQDPFFVGPEGETSHVVIDVAGNSGVVVLHAVRCHRAKAHLPIPSCSHGMPCGRRSISLHPSPTTEGYIKVQPCRVGTLQALKHRAASSPPRRRVGPRSK